MTKSYFHKPLDRLGRAISTEIAKIVTAPDMKAEAVKDAPAVTQAVLQDAATLQAGDSAQLQRPTPPVTPSANP